MFTKKLKLEGTQQLKQNVLDKKRLKGPKNQHIENGLKMRRHFVHFKNNTIHIEKGN